MSSKFAKQYQVPPEFPEILKDFAREVLRNQPSNIYEYAAKYFDCLASGLPADAHGGGAAADAARDGGEMDMSLDEVEAIIQDLFRKYDQDGNCFLDKDEFKSLMEDLQRRLDFPQDEVLRFLAEADMNSDGMIEYEEFIPLALQIIQGLYAKKRLQQHMDDVTQHAEDLLVHGMSREELTDLVESIFRRMDEDGSGTLNKSEFVAALTSMELGLTRREINTIMFRVDQDQDGNISYGEFVPFAFDLLQKLTSMRLLETELENDQLGKYLIDLFKAKDVEMSGALHVDDIRDVLHQAMLGLSRMQIFTVISEAELNSDNCIVYSTFIPRAVALIRSMLSFEKSLVRDSSALNEIEERFYQHMTAAFPPGTVASVVDVVAALESSGVLDDRELQAAMQLLSADGETVECDTAKTELWALIRSMRRHTEA
jgi:Ca2+-binding EF-hand superfamily protein